MLTSSYIDHKSFSKKKINNNSIEKASTQNSSFLMEVMHQLSPIYKLINKHSRSILRKV